MGEGLQLINYRVLATISYPLHSLKLSGPSSVTLATRDIMLGQASLKCNCCCLLSSINNLIYGALCKSHEFTACISVHDSVVASVNDWEKGKF